MHHICTVCGNYCEDNAKFCPACGTPITNVAPEVTIQPQPVVQPQPTVQPQPVMQPQPSVQPQPVMQPQASIQPQQMEPPKKKKHTVLWIVLGVVGGIILLLVILFVILFFLLAGTYTTNRHNSNIPSNTGIGSDGNYQEYYYPDFENPSFNSEAFVDITTEAPAVEATTESTVLE